MKILSLIFTFIALASCSHQGAVLSKQELAPNDSNSLHVAVVPILHALPIYYAERTGMMESRGVNMKLLRYNALMDVDTAIIKKHADIAISDIIKAIQNKETPVVSIWSVNEPMSLVVIKEKRVKKVRQMKEKMIAISRLSISDYWCDKMIDTSEIRYQDFYRPQINDIKLRTDMLRTGLVDAAILPEPYAEWMKAEKHTILKSTTQSDLQMGAWIAQKKLFCDNTKKEQVKEFINVYTEAVKIINENTDVQTVKDILIYEYGLPSALADSIQMPIITTGRPTSSKEIEAAAKWLKARNKLTQDICTDSLIHNP